MERLTKRIGTYKDCYRTCGQCEKCQCEHISDMVLNLCHREDAEERGGWISAKDRLPEELPRDNPNNGWSDIVRPSIDVLCMTKDDVFKAWYSYETHDWTRHDETASYDTVTHWQPLPEPPQEQTKEQEEKTE